MIKTTCRCHEPCPHALLNLIPDKRIPMKSHNIAAEPILWKTLSNNFQCAKVLSIIMVMIGHYYKAFPYLWVPVTMGVFVFAFSSGFFTAAKYQPGFDRQKFWNRKFHRIFITLLLTDTLLFLLFYSQHRTGIWTFASLVNVLGLTGILNWFSLPNPSPFGAGLWFLTLLYLFYITYPVILKLFGPKCSQKNSWIKAIGFSLLMWFTGSHIQTGHSLWLTACGFIWGVVIQYHGKEYKKKLPILFLIGSIFMMAINNMVFSIKIFNFPLLLVCSLCLCLTLTKWRLPLLLTKLTTPLNGSIFFIYLLHPYLFVAFSSNGLLNTTSCVILVCITGKILDMFLTATPILASNLLQKART